MVEAREAPLFRGVWSKVWPQFSAHICLPETSRERPSQHVASQSQTKGLFQGEALCCLLMQTYTTSSDHFSLQRQRHE